MKARYNQMQNEDGTWYVIDTLTNTIVSRTDLTHAQAFNLTWSLNGMLRL